MRRGRKRVLWPIQRAATVPVPVGKNIKVNVLVGLCVHAARQIPSSIMLNEFIPCCFTHSDTAHTSGQCLLVSHGVSTFRSVVAYRAGKEAHALVTAIDRTRTRMAWSRAAE